MTDYLKIYENFKDIKEVKDYIEDVTLLRHYYVTRQFSQMQDHIHKMMNKHFVETIIWNSVNTTQPATVEQSYINAENFMKIQGAKIITKTVEDYSQRLSKEESGFIETIIKSME